MNDIYIFWQQIDINLLKISHFRTVLGDDGATVSSQILNWQFTAKSYPLPTQRNINLNTFLASFQKRNTSQTTGNWKFRHFSGLLWRDWIKKCWKCPRRTFSNHKLRAKLTVCRETYPLHIQRFTQWRWPAKFSKSVKPAISESDQQISKTQGSTLCK